MGMVHQGKNQAEALTQMQALMMDISHAGTFSVVGSYLQVIVVLKVDLLQAVHVAQHPGHRGKAVALQTNGLQVWQSRQSAG